MVGDAIVLTQWPLESGDGDVSIVRAAKGSDVAGAESPMPILRQALITDIPAMWEIRYAVTENTLAPGRISDEAFRQAIEDTGRGWVVEEDGQIQAFAVGNGGTGNVWALFVKPDAQGRGHGTALHAAMLAWFQTQKIDRLWLSTGTDTRARVFYEKNGWTCIGPYGTSEVRYERPNEKSNSDGTGNRHSGRATLMVRSSTAMTSRPTFASIDAYIEAADPDVQEILRHLRSAVTAAVPDAAECISYQMPALRHQKVFFYYAAFKKHIGVYPPVHDPALAEALARYRGPKGNLQFPLDEPLPLALIARVAKSLASQYAVAPR